MSNAKLTIGNTQVQGFVNIVGKTSKGLDYLVVGSGSYKTRSGETVFKGNVTAFIVDAALPVPAKGALVRLTGDLSVAHRKDKEGNVLDELQATMDIRRDFQVVVVPKKDNEQSAPTQAQAPARQAQAQAPADDDI